MGASSVLETYPKASHEPLGKVLPAMFNMEPGVDFVEPLIEGGAYARSLLRDADNPLHSCQSVDQYLNRSLGEHITTVREVSQRS